MLPPGVRAATLHKIKHWWDFFLLFVPAAWRCIFFKNGRVSAILCTQYKYFAWIDRRIHFNLKAEVFWMLRRLSLVAVIVIWLAPSYIDCSFGLISRRRRRSSWLNTAALWPAWWAGPRLWSSSVRAARTQPSETPRPSKPFAITDRSRYYKRGV